MKKFHLVKIRFDKRTPAITQQWLQRRYSFFVAHTLKSLDAQTTTDWVLWLSFQAGMEEDAKPLLGLLTYSHMRKPWVATFGDMGPADEIMTQMPEQRTKDLLASDYVYITRLDSDDLYAPDALELVQKCEPRRIGDVEASLFSRGYLHSVKDGRTGVYSSPSPPFHTIMMPTETFVNATAYEKVWKQVGDHSKVSSLPHQVLPDWKFTVLIHGDNFLSDFDYRRVSGLVEAGWTEQFFLDRPVVFDVDDFSLPYGGAETLTHLDRLKEQYPHFRCTLFTIPNQTPPELVQKASERPWIELALHGWDHQPVEELKSLTPYALKLLYTKLVTTDSKYTRGFRPPGWYITPKHIEVLNELGCWVALNKRDQQLRKYCKHGYYMCDDRNPHWHGHTHDVCGNWLKAALPELLTKWPHQQKFAFVSEAVLKEV